MQQNKTSPISFAERYDFLYELGAGAVGVVYKARDKLLDKDVAIKLLKYKGTSKTVMRFQHEARACARLIHKNILTVMDFGATDDGEPYLVLDFIEGKTLQSALAENGPFALEEAMPLILELCTAMAYAHAQGVLHRDLKPSNLMLVHAEDNLPSLKIMDFGLAKLHESETDRSDEVSLTSSGSGIGSPLYMSPEQGTGADVDERTDIYSFGCIVFEMLTGHTPIKGENALDVMRRREAEPAPAMQSVNHDIEIPQAFEAIVAKCLARQKVDRYRSFSNLRDALLQFVNSGAIEIDEQIQAVKNEAASQIALEQSKVSKTAFAVALIALALAIGVGTFVQNATVEPKNEKFMLGAHDSSDHMILPELTKPTYRVGKDHVYITTMNGEQLSKIVDKHYANKNVIKLMQCDLTGEALKPIAGLQFGAVTIDGCTADDTTLAYLGQMKELDHLWLVRTPSVFSPPGFRNLSKAPRLASLDINQATFTDEDLEAISSFKHLCNLNLQGKGVTARGLSHFNQTPKLKTMDIGIELSDEAISTICSMKRLTKIGLTAIQPGQLKRHMKELLAMPKLLHLEIVRTTLSSDDFSELSKLKHLETLNIDSVRMPDKKPLHDLLLASNIEHLTLTNMGHLSDDEIVQLGEKSGLKQLSLNGAYDTHDEIVARLAKLRPKLIVSTQRIM